MEQDISQNPPLIGAWELISWEIRKSNGETILPLGENPRGLIIYTRSGLISVHMMRSDQPLLNFEDWVEGSVEKVKTLHEKGTPYYGDSYYGTYEIDSKKGCVIHHTEKTMYVDFGGKPQQRFYEFSENQLRLSSSKAFDGGEITSTLLWKRRE